MRDFRYENLRPDEIIKERENRSIIYLPLGPLEWHGPAMPMGTDPVLAEVAAQEAVQKTGGLVLPTLYAGTERERSEELLHAMGFGEDVTYVIGQDVPKNTLKSFYFREEVFALIVREYLRILSEQDFRLIVIVNGHGAANQIETLQRLAVEFSHETGSRVIVTGTFGRISEMDDYEGHGTKAETSLQMYVRPENVDLHMLPDGPLKNTDFGINGGKVYALQPNETGTIEKECDPRDASAQLGRQYLDAAVQEIVKAVMGQWEQIQKEDRKP